MAASICWKIAAPKRFAGPGRHAMRQVEECLGAAQALPVHLFLFPLVFSRLLFSLLVSSRLLSSPLRYAERAKRVSHSSI